MLTEIVKMDSAKLAVQGILEPGHSAYKTFTPTVATVAAVILAMFCAFVEYEVPDHTAGQVAQVGMRKAVSVHGTMDCCKIRNSCTSTYTTLFMQ